MLFHTDVYLPKAIRFKSGSLVKLVDHELQGRLKISHHARRAAESDRYGFIEIPQYFDAKYAKLIEVEVDRETEKVTKRVFRVEYDDVLDLVMVITSDWVLKTVWFNRRDDLHCTLDESKYVARPRVMH